MEFFQNAEAVRLRSYNYEKYLVAADDTESVKQSRNGFSNGARWTVEFVTASNDSFIRLRSCYDRYLTASKVPFLLGLTGCCVVQTNPAYLDYSVGWRVVRDGNHVRLINLQNTSFLRANGGLPPWRNTVTHQISNYSSNPDWLWDVEILERQYSMPRKILDSHPDSTSSNVSSRPPVVENTEPSSQMFYNGLAVPATTVAAAPAPGQGLQIAQLVLSGTNDLISMANLAEKIAVDVNSGALDSISSLF